MPINFSELALAKKLCTPTEGLLGLAASEATKDIVRTVHVTRGDTPTQLEDAQARHLPFFPDHSCV